VVSFWKRKKPCESTSIAVCGNAQHSQGF
jgi:hypothetical protein